MPNPTPPPTSVPSAHVTPASTWRCEAERYRCRARRCCRDNARPTCRRSASRSSSDAVAWTLCAITDRAPLSCVALVDRQIVGGPRKQPRHSADLRRVLVDVRLQPHVRMLRHAAAGTLRASLPTSRARIAASRHRAGARACGSARSAARSRGMRARGVTCSSGRSRRSESTSPDDDPQARRGRGLEERRGRAAKCAPNTSAVVVPCDASARRNRAPSRRHSPCRPSAPLPAARRLEPVEQRPPQRADDAQLRKMHVGVDESGKDEPAAPIDRRRAWIARRGSPV